MEKQAWVRSFGIVLTMLVISCAEATPPSDKGDRCPDVDCDDGDPCTLDSCDSESGECEYPVLADATACDADGAPSQCLDGICVEDLCTDALVRCDDAEPCTQNLCDIETGACSNPEVLDGTACPREGTAGVCSAGSCVDAMLCADVTCDDEKSCTSNTCDPLSGECAFENLTPGIQCKSGEGYLGSCDDDGSCIERFCDFDAQCDDANECTTDSCFVFANRCKNEPHSGSCNDGNGVCLFGRCSPKIILPPIELDPEPINF